MSDVNNVVRLPFSGDPDRENFNPGDHAGQLRMAHYMADWYGDKLIYVYSLNWLFWNGKCWEVDKVGEANRVAQETLKAAWGEVGKMVAQDDKNRLIAAIKRCDSTASGIAGMIKQAAAELAFVRRIDELDADPWLLNVANGTLDLHNYKLREWNPADCITQIANAAYDPEAKCELWLKSLERILPIPRVRRHFQRLAGASMVGRILPERILPLLHGDGGNGKNTVWEALVYVLGDYASLGDPNLLRHHENGTAHPTNVMDLRGKRFVVINETEEGVRMNVTLMKSLTGDNYLKARFMKKDFEQFRATHTVWVVTNHLPTVTGREKAAWDRMQVIPFDVVIPEDEQILDLADQLKLEADGILGWLMEGLRDYMEHGLDTPPEVLRKTEKYQHDNDDVARFIDDECLTEARAGTKVSAWATTQELYNRYTPWWRAECSADPRKRMLGRKQFGMELDRLGYEVREGNRKPRVGIRLSPEPEGRNVLVRRSF